MSALEVNEVKPRRSASAIPYINVTPLIDVLLVLLIIFMVITPLKPTRFEASVPQEPPDTPPENIKPNPLTLVVSIDTSGNLKLNENQEVGNVSAPQPLGVTLSGIFEDRKRNKAYKEGIIENPNFGNMTEDERIEKRVFIKAPQSLKYEQVVHVIDVVKGAGAAPIGLQIDDLAQ
jgi:biopolymer transport protein ExbD